MHAAGSLVRCGTSSADAPRPPTPFPKQSPESTALAAAVMAAGPIPEAGGLSSHYTVIVGSSDNARGVPFALYFNESLPPVLDALDAWIERESRSRQTLAGVRTPHARNLAPALAHLPLSVRPLILPPLACSDC